MNKLLRRVRTLPLRSRLALLVAAAVAFAVAAVSVTCWFIVRGKLYAELDADLRSAAARPVQQNLFLSAIDSCSSSPSSSLPFGPRVRGYSQIVRADGNTCVFPGATGTVKVTSADRAFAEHPDPETPIIRNGTDSDGNPVRVLTTALVVDAPTGRYAAQNAALLIAVPLRSTEATLNELALLLLLVSGVGVLGAGAAGLAVARAGLRPVDKLTEAVEHVARTEDLSIRIPVDDDSEDEVARLSRSFNSMTSALASSRELQQQLIADAGHELRTPLTSLRTNIELLGRSEETGRPIPPCRPQGAAGLGEGADDRAGLAHRRPSGTVPFGGAARGADAGGVPGGRRGVGTAPGAAARTRADDHRRAGAVVRPRRAGRAGAGRRQHPRQRGEVQSRRRHDRRPPRRRCPHRPRPRAGHPRR
ncbi:hypothetical protein GCM10020256_41310 [Streptomyces thermocoprophilus]